MLKTKFFKEIKVKTLLIFCNDCCPAFQFGNHPNIVAASAFAGLVNPENGFNEAWFNYHFEQFNIKEVLILGHANCYVMRNLLQKNVNLRNCENAKKQVLGNQLLFNKLSFLNDTLGFNFLKYQLALQKRWLELYFQETGIMGKYEPKIKLLFVDENQQSLEKITDLEFLLLTESLTKN